MELFSVLRQLLRAGHRCGAKATPSSAPQRFVHTPGEEELFPQPSSLQAAAQDSIYRWLCRHNTALAHGMCARVLLTSPRLTGAKLRGEPPPQSSSWHRPPQSLPSTEAGEGTSRGRQWEGGREGWS